MADLKAALAECFGDCDALVMTAAVGAFQVEAPRTTKIARRVSASASACLPSAS